MKCTIIAFIAGGLLAVVSGCSSSYPYLVLNDRCMCENYTYHEKRHDILFEFAAHFSINDRVTSTITITIDNDGKDTVSLKQAVAKVTSNTVDYRYNGLFQPMPYVDILSGRNYSMEMKGSDTRTLPHPVDAIVGEQMTIVLRGITANFKEIDSVVVHFQPVNPEFAS